MYDVAIIGGGVVGCCIARELSRYRLKTVLLEKEIEVGFGTSKTNSGIIHPGHHSPMGTLKGTLAVRGNALFGPLAKDLGFGFRRIGELVVARSAEEVPALEEMLQRGRDKGVPGLEMWDRATLQREEPNLSPRLVAALHAPSAGVINPYECCFALIECAQHNGVELRVNSPVTAIEPDDGHLVITTGQGPIATRFALNCAGVFADRIAALVGLHDFEIHPRKGEEYLLDAHLKGLVKRLIFPVPTKISKGVLIIPTFDGTIMLGPTAHDTEDRYDVSTTYEGAEEVFRSVREICPAIDPRETIAEFAGLRAVATGNDFIVGPTSVRGFFNVAGIQSPGLTASPAIAEYVVEQLGHEGLVLVHRDDFDPIVEPPARFAQQNWRTRQEIAKQDPRFARMVCRCELVTEGEIHRAIDHGARTVDGVKFRVRAGMGRCQGGFCTTRVMEVLSKRLDIEFHEVTKRGGDSWLVLPMPGGE